MNQFDFKRFLFAYQLVLSRSFLVGGVGEEKRRVLIPLADMFNHLPLPDANADNSQYPLANAVLHFDTTENRLSIVPIREIEKDEEVRNIFLLKKILQ